MYNIPTLTLTIDGCDYEFKCNARAVLVALGMARNPDLWEPADDGIGVALRHTQDNLITMLLATTGDTYYQGPYWRDLMDNVSFQENQEVFWSLCRLLFRDSGAFEVPGEVTDETPL